MIKTTRIKPLLRFGVPNSFVQDFAPELRKGLYILGSQMALRNQPYFPLYVQDYLTDEKLNECSASTQGIYIKLLCVMHKSDIYGTILLEQKYKQTDNQIKNFALKLAKHLLFTLEEIENALTELINQKVIILENDKIWQKRMVHDNNISELRAKVGRIGGKKTQFAKAKTEANSEYEHEDEIENEVEVDIKDVIECFDTAGFPEKAGKKFYYYYQAQNWTTGGSNPKPITDWKAKANEYFLTPNKMSWLLDLNLNIGIQNGIYAKYNTPDKLRRIAEDIANDPDLKR